MEKTIYKLNLTISYPVNWNFPMVIRDFIQNFFDALGPERFQNEFGWQELDTGIVMTAPVSFSKEWLFYIGASSKREERGRFAGQFGEGFKIASLVAYRDFHLSIRMESKDWVLTITEAENQIDGTKVMFLAYEISKRKYEDSSALILEGLSEEKIKTAREVIHTFFYEGNPRFGECILRNDDMAIYHSANRGEGKNEGYLYAAYQSRAYLEVPLIFCNHSYRSYRDDRDRGHFYSHEIKICLDEILEVLDAEIALKVLCALKSKWNGVRRKNQSVDWRPVVCKLICLIQENAAVKAEFYRLYGDVLLAGAPATCGKRTAKEALSWFRRSTFSQTKEVVIPEFAVLGIKTVDQLCNENDGFVRSRASVGKEKDYIAILEEIARMFFSDIICYDHLPECRILLNNKQKVQGYAIRIVGRKGERNVHGMKVTSSISMVSLQGDLLSKERFGMALSTYLHELLHQYGSDTSLSFRKALLLMNERILELTDVLGKIETEWRAIT